MVSVPVPITIQMIGLIASTNTMLDLWFLYLFILEPIGANGNGITHLLKLHGMQTRLSVPLAIFQGVQRLEICIWLSASPIFTYDYFAKLCSLQAEVMQNHEHANFLNGGQGEARHRKYES
jgi:hypothetical protein